MADAVMESSDMETTREDTDGVTREPCCLQPFIATTTVYNGVAMQCRPGEGTYDMEMSGGVSEQVLGNFRCTQAIQQSFCGGCSFGQYCCTHRSEFTHTLKMTSKRVQISMDEAEGCWPSMDLDNPSIGNPICGCCCLAPSGCIQTKNMGLLDIAGYAREVTVPKVQILSVFRWALSFWALLVVAVFAVAVLNTEEGQAAAGEITENAHEMGQEAYARATNTTSGLEAYASTTAAPPGSSTVPTILMGFAIICLLATIIYSLIDRVFVYGWKFVALSVLFLAPIGVFAFWNIDLIFEHLMSPEVAATVAPYQCLVNVFAKAGLAALTLPLWLLLGWVYIAGYGVRQYKIKLNFANQVQYTLTMRPEDVNQVSLLLARNLSQEPDIIEAVDVEGAGLMDGNTDMPINLPGKLLHEIDYTAGGGLKLTNVALATHSEQYAFFFGGAEIYQLTEVYIHSPIIMASLLTKLEYTTNLMPRMMRRLFYFIGTLLLVAGISLAIRDFTAPPMMPDGVTPSGAPLRYQDGTPRMGVALTVFALFVIIFPKITGCCVSKLGLDFTWGTIVLFLTLSSEDAEELMRWIIQATCRPGEYCQPGTEYGEDELGDEGGFEEAQAQSCLSPIRTLQITTLRIKITDDKTSTSYMRSGLTECDMGPEDWHERCFGLCPCSGWSRPNRDANASLSLNFGWLKGLPQDSFPGTNLAMTERMMFTLEQCMQICQILDQPFGDFVHHMWCPTLIPSDFGT